jgi:hypothetical protein
VSSRPVWESQKTEEREKGGKEGGEEGKEDGGVEKSWKAASRTPRREWPFPVPSLQGGAG